MASSISAGTTTSTGLVCTADTSGALQLATNNGTVAVTINTSQNVGVGTASPSARVDIRTAALGTALQLSDDTNYGANFIGVSGGLKLAMNGSQTFAIWQDVNPRLTIDSSGNVGIGTTSPTNGKLVITGNSVTTAQGIRLTGDTADARFICESATLGAGILGTFSAHSQLFYTNSTEQARIDTSGNFKFNSGYGSVATAYGCRAWVNFNGTGTVAIRASGNVSSITDVGAGDYRVNFTTAMPDANYSAFITSGQKGVVWGIPLFSTSNPFLTTSVGVVTQTPSDSANDNPYVCVSIFR